LSKLEIGFVLATRGELIFSPSTPNFDNIIEQAKQIENRGYQSIWVGDSVTAKPRLEALTTLAAVASQTKSPKLGTSVLLSGLRNPAILAHQISTLDVISKGRVILGVGVGGNGSKNLITEFPACGVPYAERTKRFEEGIEVMKKLWTEKQITWSRDWLTLDEIQVEPKPLQKPHPPIWIAGAHMGQIQPRQLRRIAKYGDGFMSTLIKPKEYEEAFNQVCDLAEKEGRGGNSLHSSLYMTINLNNSNKSAATTEANEFLTQYYGSQFWEDRWGPFGSTSEIIESMHSFEKAGVQTFIIRFAARDQNTQLDLFTKEVFPSFK
jgi:alkanesulfonate monooxygenase SsuD/methylene tetrahydromethanopterin reductase-like flavin-dependent oxidoreductase (luciferase family)